MKLLINASPGIFLGLHIQTRKIMNKFNHKQGKAVMSSPVDKIRNQV